MVDSKLQRSSACKPCLVGKEWDDLRETIGTQYVKGHRKLVPSIANSDWPSHIMMSAMFRIIAEVSTPPSASIIVLRLHACGFRRAITDDNNAANSSNN